MQIQPAALVLRASDRRARDLSGVKHLGRMAVCEDSQAQQAEVLDVLRVLHNLDGTEGIADSSFSSFLTQAPGNDVLADNTSAEARVGEHKPSSATSSAERTDLSEEAAGIQLAVCSAQSLGPRRVSVKFRLRANFHTSGSGAGFAADAGRGSPRTHRSPSRPTSAAARSLKACGSAHFSGQAARLQG